MPPKDPDEDTSEVSSSEDVTTAEPVPRTPRAPDPSKSLAGGHYRLGSPLGRGGMGEVIAAHDVVMDREVAIKRLLDGRPAVDLEARFLREAQIQGRLDHPSIPPVYEVGRDTDGRPYIVMKRLTGTTLAEILSGVEKGSVAYAREHLLRAFIDVCLAVELAHTRGVIHRDLKPANIMLGEFGEVYVLDWGVAKVLGESTPDGTLPMQQPSPDGVTSAGAVIGTPLYMAPEQQEGRVDIDGRADVYALGRMLCEILIAKRLRKAFGSAEQRRPSFHAPEREIAPELDEVCLAATEPARDTRIESARILADRVQRYLDGDRDHSLRRKLAEEHLQRATALYEKGAHEGGAAIREAGRALALDPSLGPAADLVGRLMLETPATLPPEVEQAIEAEDVAMIQRTARIGTRAYLAYFLFVPALIGLGLRSPTYLIALMVTVVLLVFSAWWGIKQPRARLRAPLMLLGNAVIVGLFVRMFTPFMLVAPGIAAITAMILFRSPAFRGKWMVPTVVILLIGMLVPIIGEQVGLFAPTHEYLADGVLLHSPVIHMPRVGATLGLSFYCAVVITLAAVTSQVHTRAQRVAERQLHLHAWRLRHLVPEPAARG